MTQGISFVSVFLAVIFLQYLLSIFAVLFKVFPYQAIIPSELFAVHLSL